jgi:hypothetical protein
VSAGTGRAQQGRRVLDEALRLLDALQAGDRGRTSASGADPGEPAHRGGECTVCPVCRALAALREANPEAMARVSRAVADLMAAVGEFVGAPQRAAPRPDGPSPGAPGTPRTPPTLQRIDVTD